jgi:hypothetical protein
MKFFTIVLLTFGSAIAAYGSDYTCTGSQGEVAELAILSESEIEWSEPWHSASSAGDSIGLEEAPFSKMLGFHRFALTDFYSTPDSSHVLALDTLVGSHLIAVTYFDNDDHVENEVSFECILK